MYIYIILFFNYKLHLHKVGSLHEDKLLQHYLNKTCPVVNGHLNLFHIYMYFCTHNFRWSRWTRQFYYGASYKKSNKVHVLWQCAISCSLQSRRAVGALSCALYWKIVPPLLWERITASTFTPWVTKRWSETLKLLSKNQKDPNLLQCWRPWTCETEKLNLKNVFCVKLVGSFYLLCNFNFLPS